MRFSGHLDAGIALQGGLRSAVLSETTLPTAERAPFPFITVSRQAGAGGRSLAVKMLERLNRIDPPRPGEPTWTAWDHELVAKVAQDHAIDEEVVEMLETNKHPWFSELLAGLSLHSDPRRPDEYGVYKRIAATIRGLAKLGRVILVGRGGVFLTRDLPAGAHLRLVAPLERRIEAAAAQRGLSPVAAAEWLTQTDQARAEFYRRHWPLASLEPETFDMVLNTAGLSDESMVDCITPLVAQYVTAGR